MNVAALYPSASGGSGPTLSPLGASSAPAPAQLSVAAETTAPVPAAPPPAAAAPTIRHDEYGLEVPATPAARDGNVVDAPGAEHAAAAAAPPDMRVDTRKDFFANARMSEPVPSGPMDYAPVARLPGGIESTDGVALAMSAAARAGIGVTAFAGIWSAWIDAERQPIATTAQAAKAALVDAYGDQADEKLAIAKQFVDGISDRWPGFKDVLQRTHLGNSPDFVKAIIRIAEQRRR